MEGELDYIIVQANFSLAPLRAPIYDLKCSLELLMLPMYVLDLHRYEATLLAVLIGHTTERRLERIYRIQYHGESGLVLNQLLPMKAVHV